MAFSRFCGTKFLPVVLLPCFSLTSLYRNACANCAAPDGRGDTYARRSSDAGNDRTACHIQPVADILNASTMTITHPRELLEARSLQFGEIFISRLSNLIYSCALSGKEQPAFLALRRWNNRAAFFRVTS